VPDGEARLDERPVEVDAARLLLLLDRFAREPDAEIDGLRCRPDRPFVRTLSPEYYLQKLDFLVRYPSYLAYELIELHERGVPTAADGTEVRATVRALVDAGQPEFRTTPFRKFWRGAYERLDDVEAWWYSRRLVFTGQEPRGQAATPGRPQKYFFLTALGEATARRLAAEVPEAGWYVDRIALIHRYFGGLSAAELKALQYSHAPYREAQLNEYIPDLSMEDVEANFERVFGVPMAGAHV
jgi:hypothetical protein